MTRSPCALLALAASTLAACAMPPQQTAGTSYEEPAIVTGSHVARKTPPAGVQAIDGDSLRAQGQLAPNRGLAGQKSQQ